MPHHETRSSLLPSPLAENIKCELYVLGLFAQSELSSEGKIHSRKPSYTHPFERQQEIAAKHYYYKNGDYE